MLDLPHLPLADFFAFYNRRETLALSPEGVARIQACRDYLEQKLKTHEAPIYGINTGFGSLCNTQVGTEELETLQYNLIRSHACGMGEEVPQAVVRLMLLTKIRSLAFGYSGVQLATMQRLVDLYNHDILPVVYTQGSLGASGDLAPLAHLCLPLIGEGEVWFEGNKRPAAEVLAAKGWSPIRLGAKEGLALLNGTQFMLSYALYVLMQAENLWEQANVIAALSLDGFDGRLDPFQASLHRVRPHKGQELAAAAMRKLLEGSEIAVRPKLHVQDPYSFRCIPQVHGASYDAIAYCKGVFQTEFDSATDNPMVFADTDEILSGGNFHGQCLALSLDFLAIALAELASISERRTYQLIGGLRGLPAFLTHNPGLNSGFMIPQYTAASIVSQNKQLCTPASVDTIPSSQNQEDHVSMGANAATKCLKVAENLRSVLAIELFAASQALSFREPLQTSPFLHTFLCSFRNTVPLIGDDESMYKHLHKSVEFLQCKILI